MENEFVLKEKARKNSLRDGAFYGVMDGFGLRYITPYALALGLSNKLIGVLEVLPTLIGNFLRVILTKEYYKHSRKKMVLPFVFIQAFFWIPLILVGISYFFLGLKFYYAALFLIICYSIIIVSGAVASPSWTSWMQDLVESNRGTYFGRRNRINGLVVMMSMITAGIVLDYFKQGQVFFGFAILFLIASIGRYISFYFLKKQYEPQAVKSDNSYFSLFQFVKKMHSNNFGRFVIFTSIIAFAVAVASPFFSVYLIKDLEFSYLAFTLIKLSELVSPLLFLTFIGKRIDKLGTVRVIKFTGILVSFVPLLWIFSIFLMKSQSWVLITYLFAVEFFSGFAWAAYNLSVSNFIYDAVTKQKIILCFAYFGFINSIGSFFGGLLGGQISSLYSLSIFGLSGILLVFLISFILRIIPALLLAPKLKEVRPVEISKSEGPRFKEKIDSFFKLINFYNPKPK